MRRRVCAALAKRSRVRVEGSTCRFPGGHEGLRSSHRGGNLFLCHVGVAAGFYEGERQGELILQRIQAVLNSASAIHRCAASRRKYTCASPPLPFAGRFRFHGAVSSSSFCGVGGRQHPADPLLSRRRRGQCRLCPSSAFPRAALRMHHVRFAGLCSLQLNQARNPQESGPDMLAVLNWAFTPSSRSP